MSGEPTLALYSRREVTRAALAAAATQAGLAVVELTADPRSLVAAASSPVAVRAPGGLVAAAMAMGAHVTLSGPDADWLVGLDTSITGRQWRRANPSIARQMLRAGPTWIKLADAKHPLVPARRYSDVASFDVAIRPLGHAPDLQLLATSGWLDIDSEYRVFCRGRDVLTASPYLIQDEPWTALLHTHRASFHREAAAYMTDVLATLPDSEVPPAAAFDIARLADGRMVVLEANQSWSAGIYGCDPDAVLAAVLAANTPGPASRWAWTPDPSLVDTWTT
jgi:hypothetical protein